MSKSNSKGVDKSKNKSYDDEDCSDDEGNDSSFVQVVVASYDDGYESVAALVATSQKPKKSWFIHSGYSYHTWLRNEYIETLEVKEVGVVRLGKNKSCNIQVMESIRLNIFDNCEFLLENELCL